MSQQLNFAELKRRISIAQGAKMLGLNLAKDGNSLRCACPACISDEEYEAVTRIKDQTDREKRLKIIDRTLSILEDNNTFKCFASGKYGSVLDLVCHVKQMSLREAGKWLMERETEEWLDEYSDSCPEESEVVLPALEKLPQLDSTHEAVQELGIDTTLAKALGIGFAGRGVLAGSVGVPLYLDGHIVGYLGIPKGTVLKLPKNLKGGGP